MLLLAPTLADHAVVDDEAMRPCTHWGKARFTADGPTFEIHHKSVDALGQRPVSGCSIDEFAFGEARRRGNLMSLCEQGGSRHVVCVNTELDAGAAHRQMMAMMMTPAPETTIAEAAVRTDYIERRERLACSGTTTLGQGFDARGAADIFEERKFSTTIRNYRLENVHLDTAAMTLFQDGKKIKESYYLVPPDYYERACVIEDGLIELELGIDYVMARAFANNYYHWLVQSIPAVDWFLRNFGTTGVALLTGHLNRWQLEMLSILGYDRVPRIALDPRHHYSIPLLEYCDFQNGSTAFEISLTAQATFRRLAAAVRNSLSETAGIIYVARTDTTNRVAENEEKIIELLQREGISIVIPGHLTVSQQINVFAKAKAVIGAHGAGLTNIVFCRPGTVVYELIPDHYLNSCFHRLAQAADLNYIVDLFRSHPDGGDDPHSRPWTLDADVILSRLSDIKLQVGPPRAASISVTDHPSAMNNLKNNTSPPPTIEAVATGSVRKRAPKSSSQDYVLTVPIAAAARATGYFEKSCLFRGRSEIKLSDGLSHQESGVSFWTPGVTTAVRNYTIENVVLDARTLLLVQDGRVIPETAYFVPEDKRTALKIDRAALVRLDTSDDVIIGYNNAHWGYQHWLTQCLPAIDWSLRQRRTRGYRLLLPTLEPWQEDFIRILGYDAVRRFTPTAGAQYLLPRVEYSEFLNGSTSFGICLSTRDTARRVLDALPSFPSRHKILYVPCVNPYYGAIDNEDEVVELLGHYGVCIVDQRHLSTADRINLFRHADVVIGPLGQGLADVIFCKPGALLWEWMPKHHQNASFNRLAQAAEVDYWGELFESPIGPAASGPWHVDIAAVSHQMFKLFSRLARRAMGIATAQAEAVGEANTEISGPKATSKPIDELMLAFESLGDNCEFGLVQRRGGAEPLGLLRFSGIFLPIEVRLQTLAAALERKFEGLGALETITVYLAGEPGRREFMVRESAYNLMYHTEVLEGEIGPEEMREREAKRLHFLRRKLLEDLNIGEKIWVWKSAATLDTNQVQPLLHALRSLGPNILLWVVEGDERHPPGSIEQLDHDFIKGYIERFAPYESAPEIRPVSWFEVCEKTYDLYHPTPPPSGRQEIPDGVSPQRQDTQDRAPPEPEDAPLIQLQGSLPVLDILTLALNPSVSTASRSSVDSIPRVDTSAFEHHVRNRWLMGQRLLASIKTEWKPGDTVDRTGLYSVRHGDEHKLPGSQHTLQHQVICLKGRKFPLCNHCGDRPRFNRVGAGEPIDQNDYFK